ncbi:D-alanyl-D-alanine carboxypeptidase [Lentilactobacillus kosonis]|uniref:D-alanyl-D-alanine carboxypeptidase n=1 Tax=Lentilactobacillus kosonis TaxID=2810561 RepID=A0A401FM51_9LACO|nr:D-alanyl-D-alanine carboxypeptidase [Lentilactobacillus kosonis]GAY73465.1 D-alanyl-D-alanine carboxypeptidase [Lentilactobacillus kosonis]
MKKTIKLAMLTLGMLIGFAGVLGQQANASKTQSVPSNYSYSSDWHYGPVPYYSISKNKDAYIWNNQHTKKVHNLKNYQNTIWMVSNAYVKRVKGNNEVYYKMYSVYDPKVKGTAWSGYFKKNLQEIPNLFHNNESFENYLNSNRASKLAKMVTQLFPNSQVNVNLSKYAYFREEKYIKNFSNLQNIYPHDDNLKISYEKMAPSLGIKYIEKYLDNHGYDAEKRKSMTNYRIGVSIVGNAEAIYDKNGLTLAEQYFYPVQLNNFVDMIDYNGCQIYLGIPNK